MSRDIAPFGLRMQPELRQQIEEAARVSGRSLNAEICHRLEQTFAGQATSDPTGQQFAEQLRDLQQRMRLVEATIKGEK